MVMVWVDLGHSCYAMSVRNVELDRGKVVCLMSVRMVPMMPDGRKQLLQIWNYWMVCCYSSQGLECFISGSSSSKAAVIAKRIHGCLEPLRQASICGCE